MIKDNFKITESASYKIQKLLLDENSSFFRVSVDGGGCSGFQYKFLVENSKNNDDLEFKQFGVKVIVDELSLQFYYEASQINNVPLLVQDPCSSLLQSQQRFFFP